MAYLTTENKSTFRTLGYVVKRNTVIPEQLKIWFRFRGSHTDIIAKQNIN